MHLPAIIKFQDPIHPPSTYNFIAHRTINVISSQNIRVRLKIYEQYPPFLLFGFSLLQNEFTNLIVVWIYPVIRCSSPEYGLQ